MEPKEGAGFCSLTSTNAVVSLNSDGRIGREGEVLAMKYPPICVGCPDKGRATEGKLEKGISWLGTRQHPMRLRIYYK